MCASVLIVDDDPYILDLISIVIEEAGWDAERASSATECFQRIDEIEPKAVVLDLFLPDAPGLEVLKKLVAREGAPPVIILTGRGDVGAAVECMRLGAFDFVQKPFENARLLASVRNALDHRDLERRVSSLTRELRAKEGFANLIGKSRALGESVKLLSRAAASDVTCLVLGESGTGKEVAARILHAESRRRSGPFIAVNCGAIPETLIESELFGHEKGAFTGAATVRRGAFEEADGGTIFLDEIGELRLDLQVRLLRVLQERSVQRIGAVRPRSVDIRVVAATNRDLKAEITKGRFREDLFYRLATFPVTLPPLRERDGDIILLADVFVENFAHRHGRKIRGLTPEASDALKRWNWPGNVRELENVIERAVILEDGDRIRPSSLPEELTRNAGLPADPPAAAIEPSGARDAHADGPMESRNETSAPEKCPADVLWVHPRTADDLIDFDSIERHIIAEALRVTGWNVQDAADRLHIGRATLYRKIDRFGLKSGV